MEGQRGACKLTAGILRARERRDPSDIFSRIKSASYSTAYGSESLVFAAISLWPITSQYCLKDEYCDVKGHGEIAANNNANRIKYCILQTTPS